MLSLSREKEAQTADNLLAVRFIHKPAVRASFSRENRFRREHFLQCDIPSLEPQVENVFPTF